MHDKNYNGSIDLDECVQLLYARFGKVRRVLASRPVPFAPHPATTHHVPSASRLSPPASRLPPPCLPTPRAVRAPAPAALLQEVVDKRVREMFGQSDTEKNISFSKCATAAPPPRPAAPSPRPAAPSPRPAAPRRAPPRPAAPRRAPPRPAAPRRHLCSAPAPLECSLSWEAQHWAGARTHMHARARTHRVREGEEGGRMREHKAERPEGGESAVAFVPHHPCPLRPLQVRGHPEAELQPEGR
jgi:hypothetical protein